MGHHEYIFSVLIGDLFVGGELVVWTRSKNVFKEKNFRKKKGKNESALFYKKHSKNVWFVNVNQSTWSKHSFYHNCFH